MSKAAFERAIEGMDSVFNEIKDIPHDIGPKKTRQEEIQQDRKHIGKETVTKTCAGTMKVHRKSGKQVMQLSRKIIHVMTT